MDLPDATLMFLVEAAGYPAVAELAQSAHERLVRGEDVAFEAIVMPVLQEVGRRAPIRSGRPEYVWQPGEDPLTAGLPAMAPTV